MFVLGMLFRGHNRIKKRNDLFKFIFMLCDIALLSSVEKDFALTGLPLYRLKGHLMRSYLVQTSILLSKICKNGIFSPNFKNSKNQLAVHCGWWYFTWLNSTITGFIWKKIKYIKSHQERHLNFENSKTLIASSALLGNDRIKI